MGVVDQDYIAKATDREAVVGRKIRIKSDEVKGLLQLVGKVTHKLSADLAKAGR